MKFVFYAELDLRNDMKNMNVGDVEKAIKVVLDKINRADSQPKIRVGGLYNEVKRSDTKLADEELCIYVPGQEDEPLYIVNAPYMGNDPEERLSSIDPFDFNYGDYVATELYVSMPRIERHGTAIESSIDEFAKAYVGDFGFSVMEDMIVNSNDTGDDSMGEYWITVQRKA